MPCLKQAIKIGGKQFFQGAHVEGMASLSHERRAVVYKMWYPLPQ